MSWFSYDGANSYAATKAAQWALTNGVRLELGPQHTLVTALHIGSVDTDMMAGYDEDSSIQLGDNGESDPFVRVTYELV